MKRNYIILLAALLTVACAGNGDTMSPTPQEGEILFSGSTVGPKVRTSYEDTETALRVNWVKNDLIGLFAESGGKNLGANFAYKAAVSGATSDFTAASRLNVIRWADETSDHDFYAYYPYTDRAAVDVTAIPVSVPAVQTRSESDPLATLAAHDFLYAVTCGIKKGDNAVNLQFKHLFSALEIRLTTDLRAKLEGVIFRCVSNENAAVSMENATVDLRTGEVNVSEAVVSNAVRLDCSGNTSDTEALVLHLVVTPGHAGETFEAVALVNGKEYIFATVKAPADGGIPTGKTVVVEGEATLDPEDALPVIDLSAEGTANTYYADAANTFYRFRADVKGNGKALTCGGLSYTEEDLRIEPKAALVLWYSCLQTSYLPWIQASPVVLSSVKFKKDGYIYFDTPETFVNGNVVIVAIDKELGYDQIEADADKRITNAEVLWSWNIVFSEGYDPDAAENRIVKGGYTWMNRDLGALIDPEQAYIGGQLNNVALASTTGNCYQWGRKDPFPGLPDYTSVQVSYMTGLWFAPAYTPIPALDRGTFEAWGREAHHQIIGNTKATVAIDINTALGTGYVSQDAFDLGRANPHLWLYKNENYLTDKAGLAAWGNPSKDAHGVKTIYDPCPPGWKVMSSQAWIALTDNETPDAVVATTMRGILLDNKWYFPLTGGAQHVRNSDGGSNGYTGSCGVEVCTAYYMDGPDYSPWGRVGAFKAAPNYKEGDSVTCQSQNTYSDRGASVRCIRIDE